MVVQVFVARWWLVVVVAVSGAARLPERLLSVVAASGVAKCGCQVCVRWCLLKSFRGGCCQVVAASWLPEWLLPGGAFEWLLPRVAQSVVARWWLPSAARAVVAKSAARSLRNAAKLSRT